MFATLNRRKSTATGMGRSQRTKVGSFLHLRQLGLCYLQTSTFCWKQRRRPGSQDVPREHHPTGSGINNKLLLRKVQGGLHWWVFYSEYCFLDISLFFLKFSLWLTQREKVSKWENFNLPSDNIYRTQAFSVRLDLMSSF